MRARKPSRKPPQLTQESLESLALRYVERYATTEAKLAIYLSRKLRERGWAGLEVPAIESIVSRFAALGYVDDRQFAETRARGLERRGYGARRIGAALAAAGIKADVREDIADTLDARAAALALARRRRFGPFGEAVDHAGRQRQFAAMLRAGHAPGVVAEILGAASEDALYEE